MATLVASTAFVKLLDDLGDGAGGSSSSSKAGPNLGYFDNIVIVSGACGRGG